MTHLDRLIETMKQSGFVPGLKLHGTAKATCDFIDLMANTESYTGPGPDMGFAWKCITWASERNGGYRKIGY
jgi:hypothetical protein